MICTFARADKKTNWIGWFMANKTIKIRENIAYKAHDSTRIADILVYGVLCFFPRANSIFFINDSMRQSISPVAMTEVDTDSTKYGKAKAISPLAHNEPLGKDVWMMNIKPIARDPRYIKAGNATARAL